MKQNADGTEQPVPHVDRVQVEQEGRPVASGFGWLDAAWKAAPLADILLKDPPPQRWLLENVLPLGEVAMLAAEGGAGKTMALLQLALAVALPAEAGTERTHWLGFPIGAEAQSGRVLVVLGEETTETVWRRFRRVVEGLNLAPWLSDVIREERIRFIAGASVGGSLALVDNENQATDLVGGLRRRMEDDGAPYSLVILDPAAQFSDGQFEVDNGAATAFVRALQDLARAPGGPTILLAHHTSQGSRTAKKATATAARGVTGLNDAVRWHAHMQPRDPFRLDDGTEVRTVEFEVVKANNAAIPAGQLLERMEYGVLVPVKPAQRADYAKRAAVAAKLAEWTQAEQDNEVFEAACAVRNPPADAAKAFRDRLKVNTQKAKQGTQALAKAKGKPVRSVKPDNDNDDDWRVP